jgi:DNA-binding phage protein
MLELIATMAESRERAEQAGHYRRWIHPFRDDSRLAALFDRALLAVTGELSRLQTRNGHTYHQLATGSQLSRRGIMKILNAQSDPKISTLVRLAAHFDCDVVVTLRPRAGTGVR